jgi:Rod binding domain-containing protein
MQAIEGIAGGTQLERGASRARLVESAHEFEAQLMKELIQPMLKSDEAGDEAGSEGALEQFSGEILGQSLSRAGGFGIANRIISSLSRTETGCLSDSDAGKCGRSEQPDLKSFSRMPITLPRRVAYGNQE